MGARSPSPGNRALQRLVESRLLSTQFHYIEHSGSAYSKQIVWLQLITVVWMCAEAAIAIFAALRAHSVALLGFGADSGIELLSAFVVFLRFEKASRINETNATRLAGLLLFALAAFILGSSLLAFVNPRFRPEPSYLGIGLLIAAAIVMPWLSHQKRTLAAKTNSSSLKADAVQSAMCAYLASIALAGLLLNAVFRISWADPTAALLLLPIVVQGWESMRGKAGCECA